VNVLIDTAIWSLVLRRQSPNQQLAGEVRQLVAENRAAIIGPIRQEVLSGIPNESQFKQLRSKLQAFADIPLITQHFELAAELSNLCRSKGIIGSHIDFLICAVSKHDKLAIFTTDHDFRHYSKAIGLALFKFQAGS
jgi:predicted nucleic acid-binding protein